VPAAAHDGALWHPSPNCGARRGGALPDTVVVHYTAMASAEAALARLCDPGAEVSAHYLICERGRLWQLVAEADRAWHAGAGRWGAVDDVNSASIGIELANRGDHPFPEPQMRALEMVLAGVMDRWRIRPERVIAHSDMAPERKRDPGARFDWRRLARAGLSIWPEAARAAQERPDAARLRELAERIGYDARASDAALLSALRLRFRPWGRGPLSAADMGVAAELARRFPVDRGDVSA